MKNEITSIICPVCNSNHAPEYGPTRASPVITDVESGEIICSKCGMVINDRIEDMGQGRIHAHLVMRKIIIGLD